MCQILTGGATVWNTVDCLVVFKSFSLQTTPGSSDFSQVSSGVCSFPGRVPFAQGHPSCRDHLPYTCRCEVSLRVSGGWSRQEAQSPG